MTNQKPSELNPARSEHHRKWTQFNRETILIILVSICAIVTTGNHFRTNSAVDAANEANAKVDYELQASRDELTESKNRTTLYISYVQLLHADLIVKGFEPPPLPEE